MGVRKKTKSIKGRSSKRRTTQFGGDVRISQIAPAESASPQERIWQVVAMIPKGTVATYGQVAALAGMPTHARLVGRTLSNLPKGTKLPWHRVINAGMRISLRAGSGGHLVQRERLEAEGVEFVGLRVTKGFRWQP